MSFGFVQNGFVVFAGHVFLLLETSSTKHPHSVLTFLQNGFGFGDFGFNRTNFRRSSRTNLEGLSRSWAHHPHDILALLKWRPYLVGIAVAMEKFPLKMGSAQLNETFCKLNLHAIFAKKGTPNRLTTQIKCISYA